MPDQETKPMRRYWLIMARGILRFMAVLAGMFFLAGRFSYWQAWGYGGMGLLLGLTVAVLFAGKPDVIKERVRPGPGMKWWDRVFFALYIPSFLAILGVASLDAGRHHWTAALPVPAYVFAYVVLVVAFGLVTWAMWVNRFFSSVVRIQTDRATM